MPVALAALNRKLQGLDAKLVNVVHDEPVLEVAEANAPAVRDAGKRHGGEDAGYLS